MSNEDAMIGKEIGGCVIKGKLGQGGMGAVYDAVQITLQREVALKVITEAYMSNEQAKARFEQEARSVAQLVHPNIVQVHDLGQTEGGQYYLVMEKVVGGTISDLMKSKGKLSERDSLNFIKQGAAGLGAAADKNIIHRDIKPDNLMLTTKGIVKVADFGLAKNTEATGQLTHSGQIMGTPAYIAPEQADGRKADHRSDIYSLGATFFAIATGTMPYTGETAIAIVMQHITAPVPEPKERAPELSDKTCSIIRRMMAKEPSERYQTADQVIHDIDIVLENSSDQLLADMPGPIQFDNMPTIMGDMPIPGTGVGGSGAGMSVPTPRTIDAKTLEEVKQSGLGNVSMPTPHTIDASSLAVMQKQSRMMMILGIAGGAAVMAVVALILVMVLTKDDKTPQPAPPPVNNSGNDGGKEPGGEKDPVVKDNPDPGPVPIRDLQVSFSDPQNGSFVTKGRIRVKGHITPVPKKLALSINGIAVAAAGDGTFLTHIDLKEGENDIKVEATGENAKGQNMVTVKYDATPPKITITSPKITPGTLLYLKDKTLKVEGKVEDTFPRGTVEVNRRTVSLRDGVFQATVSLNPGKNTIHIEAEDEAENASPLSFIVVQDGVKPAFKFFKLPATVFSDRPEATVDGEFSEKVARHTLPEGRRTLTGRRFVIVLPLKPGPNHFDFEAVDLAGNKGSRRITIQFQRIPSSLKAGSGIGEFICRKDEAVMVKVPAGRVRMGSDTGAADQRPARFVRLDAFYMDKFEVTNNQYARFIEWVKTADNPRQFAHPDQPAGKSYVPKFWNDEAWTGKNAPVVGVDWFDAYAYARWAGKDLPTEAEWETAAGWDWKTKKQRLYPWGDFAPTSARAVFAGSRPESVLGRPKGASPVGCLDMAGNVQEWMLDWYARDYYKRAPEANPLNRQKSRFRVLRGGSWKDPVEKIRVSRRGFFLPTGRYNVIGFRCVLREKK